MRAVGNFRKNIMNQTVKQTGQTARDLAQKIAKQIAEEPGELLKNAENQIAGEEMLAARENPQSGQKSDAQAKNREHQMEVQDKLKAGRRMEAYQRELDDMRKQDLFKDLQNKIAQGVEVPLENYAELSVEQKQVLNAQMEAVKFQKQQAKYNEQQGGLPSVISKPSRRFGAGKSQKAEAEREQTRVEKPVPPSG